MTELHSELVELRQKYVTLQNEHNSKQEHVGHMQAELFKVRNQMLQQSQFCASLGAVMGNLIWKASRTSPVVDMLLSGVCYNLNFVTHVCRYSSQFFSETGGMN
jgi:hypothetical protein